MKFRAQLRREALPALATVVQSLYKVSKLNVEGNSLGGAALFSPDTGAIPAVESPTNVAASASQAQPGGALQSFAGGVQPTSDEIEFKISPNELLIRFCVDPAFGHGLHYLIHFEVREVISDMIIESLSNNIIFFYIAVKAITGALKAASFAQRAIMKLSRRDGNPSLCFELLMLGEGNKKVKLIQDCYVRLMKGPGVAEIRLPPPSLFAGSLQLSNMQSMVSFVSRACRIGAERINLTVQEIQVDTMESRDCLDSVRATQPAPTQEEHDYAVVKLEASTDVASLRAEYRGLKFVFARRTRCGQASVVQSSGHNSSQRTRRRRTDNASSDETRVATLSQPMLPPRRSQSQQTPDGATLLQTVPAKNLHAVLQFGSSLPYDFALLSVVKDQCLLFSFPLRGFQRGHALCSSSVCLEL